MRFIVLLVTRPTTAAMTNGLISIFRTLGVVTTTDDICGLQDPLIVRSFLHATDIFIGWYKTNAGVK